MPFVIGANAAPGDATVRIAWVFDLRADLHYTERQYLIREMGYLRGRYRARHRVQAGG
jgi:hypothetical protein